MDPLFWNRVCKHFTSEKIYKVNPNKCKVHQVIRPVDISSIIELDNGKKI